MDVKIETKRSKDKKALLKTAKKLSDILEDTGIKQGIHAKRIDVSQNTLCRFMGLQEDYVTKSLVDRIQKYVDENNYKQIIK